MEKFKIGDWVEVIRDDDSYPYCIGKIGRVVDHIFPTNELYVVEFDFDLPKWDATVGERTRRFHPHELHRGKEMKVLQILRQWKESSK